MASNFYGKFFRISRWIIRTIYPSYSTQLQEHVKKPVVYISHHQNLFGPFIIYLWFPHHIRTWILHVFLDRKKCFKQYVNYTFTERLGMNKTIAKIFAYPISFIIPYLLTSGKGIPVYRGSKKIMKTIQLSVEALKNGECIVIYPDVDYKDSSNETKKLHEGYLFIEKYYFKETGQHVLFVPLFVSKNKRLIISDKPISFRDHEPFLLEQKRVGNEIQKKLNTLAKQCGDID